MSGQWPELERNLREGMKCSGIFKPEMLESAIEKIKTNFSNIDNLTCFNALKRGRELTLAEKKGLGLNSRRKYLDDFISYIDLAGLNGGCPNVIYQDVFMDAVLRTGRTADLERMKAAGVKRLSFWTLMAAWDALPFGEPGKLTRSLKPRASSPPLRSGLLQVQLHR